MDLEQIKKIQEDTSKILKETFELNEKIEGFLNQRLEDDENLNDMEDHQKYEEVLEELDIELNNILLEFAPKENE